jgi:hypothetical protein
MIMVVVPIVTVIAIAIDPEDAIDSAHGTADASTDRAANNRAHRTGRAATLTRAVMSAALHAAYDALRMPGMGRHEQCQNDRRCRE